MAKCEVCGADPSTSRTVLIRQNELGVMGVWRCQRHSDLLTDPETQGIIDVLTASGTPEQEVRDGE